MSIFRPRWVPLAKVAAEEITQDDATRTVVAHLTDPGTTVGTIAYMSAEQALGQTNLAAQSDQCSLGLVLYELAAGRRAFQLQRGRNHVAIIREDPEPLPASVPAGQRRGVILTLTPLNFNACAGAARTGVGCLAFRRPKGNSG
jgi:serine/threonine protein kinase